MKLAYISPSLLPSRSANSVHVVHQCEAFSQLGLDVSLYAKRNSKNVQNLPSGLAQTYGTGLERVKLRTIFTRWSRANNVTIAIYAILRLLFADRADAVLSRNLFASFLLAVFSRIPLIIEVHQLETGFRRWMQRVAFRRSGVIVVTISEQLKKDLTLAVGRTETPVVVLHDAAPDGMEPLPEAEQRAWRREQLGDRAVEHYQLVCGYVGHLYAGRGVEVIESLARECSDVLFLVFGGNEQDVEAKCRQNSSPNLRFVGHVPHPVARRAMCSVDVLLMPYQEKVSIGLKGHDTARWMSPMKMFEYMASGTPFIASDLPVLREVLRNGHNALLVPPSDIQSWKAALFALKNDAELRRQLAQNAYADYQSEYTWRRRAERLVACVKAKCAQSS